MKNKINNKIKIIISSIILLNIFNINIFTITNASIVGNTITIVSVSEKDKKEITIGEAFIFLSYFYKNTTPSSYKYININYKNIKKGSTLEDSIKRLIYLDLIKNPSLKFNENTKISAWHFYRLAEKILGIKIKDKETKKELLERKAIFLDFKNIKNFVDKNSIDIQNTTKTPFKILQKEAILNDVYKTLLKSYYDKEKLNKEGLLNSAIEGLVKGVGDKHTVYFPPVKSKSFSDALLGEYEGIGSYVDMEKPGILKITSPIPGSPSEKAGLKGGDIVIKVDGKEITKNNSLGEVVSWIKGPAGTEVVLTIKRKGEVKNITVTRAKIVIKEVESKKLNYNTYYIQIKTFGANVANEFKNSLEPIKKDKNIKKIIIDLRNDGGGYLDQVTEILSYFVEKGKTTAVVKYHTNNYTKTFKSKGYEDIDFSKYKIIILQNSGTASASEILIGTLKDYYKDLVIIGEQSYGKGSVQVMKNYNDGSILKYTIAKWFTGGTETGIDGVGITPDIELEFDFENFKKYNRDNQLEKAKNIR